MITEKKIRKSEMSTDSFNKDFWGNVNPAKKMIIAWEMVQEINLFKGEKNECESRLQRSIQNIKRRTS